MTKDEALKLALHGLEMGVTLIEDFGSKEQLNTQHKAIAAIYEALAQPEQEPVAWLHRFIEGGISIGLKPADLKRHPERWEPLYTYPPQQELVCVCGAVWEGQELVETPPEPRPCPTCEALARTVMLDQTAHDTPPQRKPMTDEEIQYALESAFLGSDEKRNWQDDLRVARAIEAAHGIKGEA